MKPSAARCFALLSSPPLLSPRDAALLQDLTQRVTSMRLDTLLKSHGIVGRKDARLYCRSTRVEEVSPTPGAPPRAILTGSSHVDPARLLLDGKPLPLAGVPLHYALHKPRGLVCSHADDEGATVFDLFPRDVAFRSPALSCVGRLDKGASGLLIFTQSGALNERLTSPSRRVSKEYTITLQEALTPQAAHAAKHALVAGGIELADGTRAAPAEFVHHGAAAPRVCSLTLTEGRHHEVRRLLAALGHTVVALHRAAVAGLRLDALGLKEGEFRLLSELELEQLVRGSASAGGKRPPTLRLAV